MHQIGLVGKIEPQKTIILTAPFEGNVQAILVEQGQRVEAGQTLLQMDPGLLEIQLRDALSAQLKARRAVQELQDWNNSQQVARARRTLRSAQMTASNTERKLGESQNLFERGIIPRNELQDLQQQLQSQRMDLSAAEGDLQQALDQGKGEYRQIADMELTNATVKYETLKAVVAPFAGIVVPAPGANGSQNSANNNSAPVQTGSRVSQGQLLFGLANIEQLKIVSKVSELDINQLHQGQSVEILGDGFDGERLSGSVDIVSSLALPNETPGGSAQFPVTLSIPKLNREQLQRVRLGMSATRRSSCRRQRSCAMPRARRWIIARRWTNRSNACRLPPGRRRRMGSKCSACSRDSCGSSSESGQFASSSEPALVSQHWLENSYA